jgi:hypothetical protein
MEEAKEAGKRRTVWLPNNLDEKAEHVRKELGLGYSGFYRYAVVEVIKEFAKVKTAENTHSKLEVTV